MSSKLLISARAFALGVMLSAASLPAAAAAESDARLDEMQKKLEQSLQLIDSLTARVKDLEARLPHDSVVASRAPDGAPAAAAEPATDSQRIAAIEQKVSQIETTNATRQSDDSGLPLHGFADVGLGNRNLYFANLEGADIGSLDFYLSPRLGDRVVALAELIFEVGPNGQVGTDLERFQIGYQFNDKATVWIGRFHTPYGYVNTALHHGVWVADALRRPKFINFEDHGGVMPSHTVGAWMTGSQHAGPGKVLYDWYVGNGQQLEDGIVDMQSGGNPHGAAMAGSRLSYQFNGSADGLLIGIDGFTDKVSSQQTNNLTRIDMVGAYAAYDTDIWEHVVEAYSFHDTNLNGPSGINTSHAWFAQFAYRAHWGVPYVRYERAVLDQRDLYFAEQTFGASYYRAALGLRFDLNARSALKFELAHTRTTDFRTMDLSYGLPEEYNEVLGQYSIRF